MDHVFEPPKSELDDQALTNLSILRKTLGTSSVIISTALYYWLYTIVPIFLETFDSFGQELPALTFFVAKYHAAFAFMAIFSVIPLVFWVGDQLKYKTKQRLYKFSLMNGLFAIASMFLVQWAMYLPILQITESL